MKRVVPWIRVAGFIVGLVVLVAIFDYAFAQTGYVRYVLTYFQNSDEDIDTLVLGASHARSAIDPQKIDDVNDTNSFSLAIPGEMVKDSYYVLQEACRSKKIKTLIFDVDYQYWMEPQAEGYFQEPFIYNQLKKLNLYKFYSNRVINHLMSILISIFLLGYHGKTTDFAKNSSCHRTTIAHFLNSGKWDDSSLSDTLKRSVIEIIYSEAARTGKPFFCIVDDTTASKTKPSSQALHPIEDAYFHQSHLKGKQDYGHQAVAVMLSCWYTSEKIINTFAAGGFHTIGALKTNRMLYPFGFKKKLNEFAAFLTSTRSNFRLVTVKKQKYYVYRYEGKLNGIENAVVLLSYPEKAFGNPKALRAFLSTDVSLSLDETLSYYVCR